MKIKVIRGTIKQNDRKYGVGEIVETDDQNALAIIREGIAEEYVQEVSQPKAKKEKKVEVVKEEVKVEEPVVSAEPSIDWTRRELDEYAKAHGVVEPEKFGNKDEILEAIVKATGGESK